MYMHNIIEYVMLKLFIIQPFGYKVFGTAGEVIFSLFVPLSVLGGMCSMILSGARYVPTLCTSVNSSS